MKYIFLRTVLVCSILFSCSSESENSIDNESGNPVNVNLNRQATGSSANDLLSDGIFKKMIVEVGYIDGFKPTENALNNFKDFINTRVNKAEGIEFITKIIPTTGKNTYTLDEVVALEKLHRTQYNSSTTIAVWVLFINGKSSNDTNSSAILGSAYWNTSFVIYEETIQGLSDGTFEPERSLLEASVINHEFGHILGLTNLGSNLQSNHEDAEHPKHCNEEDCLMYWAAETSQGIGSVLTGGKVPTLDAQCLADLKANGGK
ncbi:membrane metalloprotease [Polaribacter sp.]|uniref:membrane metalloprotease n=1 Tax=Polaribacter sp. TaxID=1920175 RepID=UPI003EF2AE90